MTAPENNEGGNQENRRSSPGELIIVDLIKTLAVLNQNIMDLNDKVSQAIDKDEELAGKLDCVLDVIEAIGDSGANTLGGITRAIKEVTGEWYDDAEEKVKR